MTERVRKRSRGLDETAARSRMSCLRQGLIGVDGSARMVLGMGVRSQPRLRFLTCSLDFPEVLERLREFYF